MAQDTNLNTLIINKLTKAQYNAAEKSDNELYMVTDETYYTADEVDQKLQNVSVDLTGYAKETYVDQKVADLVGSSPDTLDTLNELASALGNDPNFATTITNQLSNKADKSYVDDATLKNSLPQININKPTKNSPNFNATHTYNKILARGQKDENTTVTGTNVTKTTYSFDKQNDTFYFVGDEHDTTGEYPNDDALYDSLYKSNFYKIDVTIDSRSTLYKTGSSTNLIKFNGDKKYCYLRLITGPDMSDDSATFTINYPDFDSNEPFKQIPGSASEFVIAPGYNKTKEVSLNSDVLGDYDAETTYITMIDIPLGYMPYDDTVIQVICDYTADVDDTATRSFYAKIVYDSTLIIPGTGGTIALQEEVDLKANTADLAQVAKTGSFTDLNNIPSIPSVESTATENSTNAISSGYIYTLEDKLTNGTDGYKVMTAEYADNVPVISTNISTDAESDIKTTSPKAVKSYVDSITGDINTILDTINGEVI